MITLPPAVLNIHVFASDDISRKNLTYLQLQTIGQRHVAVVTNGAQLTKVTWPVREGEEVFRAPVYLAASALKTFVKTCKGDAQLDLTGSLTAPGIVHAVEIKTDVKYPDWTLAMPSAPIRDADTEYLPTGIDPGLLASVLNHAQKYVIDYSKKSRRGIVLDTHLWSPDALGPLQITATSKEGEIEATYIIMPMRL